MTGVSKETIGCGLTRETQMHLRTLEESSRWLLMAAV